MRRLVVVLCCLALSAAAEADGLQACLNIARQQPKPGLNLKKDCPALFKELKSKRLLTASEPPLLDGASLAQLEFIAGSRRFLREPSFIRQDGLDQLLAGILEVQPHDPEVALWQAFYSGWIA
jgi:hypothetical protein